jgi:AAHS family 4-hydroxybenzoate transporter-like MFS transporter
MAQDRINIAEVVDNSRIGGFQVGVFLLCAACLILDGFDVFALGFVNPDIRKELALDATRMGWVITSGLVGILIGALGFGGMGDRLGRRPVLIIATASFAVLTLLTGFATSLAQLVVLRLLAGIGLGGIMPNVVSLVGEYCPKRSRALVVILVQNGFNLGGVLAGFVALWLVPEHGWRSVFYVGGLIPLAIAACMLPWLPESLQLLAMRARSSAGHATAHARETAAIRKWLARSAPSVQATPSSEYVVAERPKGGLPAGRLFEDGRGVGTVLLWVVNFMNILNIYFLTGWGPAVFRDAGFSQGTSFWVGITLLLGGTAGTLVLAWLVSVLGYIRVLTAASGLGAVAVASMGLPLSAGMFFAVIFSAGFCIIGAQGGLNALAAAFYPTDLRSTGIGYALGVGRIGGIVGAPIAGALIDRGWMAGQIFLAASGPALIAAAAIFSLRTRVKAQGENAAVPQPEVAAH